MLVSLKGGFYKFKMAPLGEAYSLGATKQKMPTTVDMQTLGLELAQAVVSCRFKMLLLGLH